MQYSIVWLGNTETKERRCNDVGNLWDVNMTANGKKGRENEQRQSSMDKDGIMALYKFRIIIIIIIHRLL